MGIRSLFVPMVNCLDGRYIGRRLLEEYEALLEVNEAMDQMSR